MGKITSNEILISARIKASQFVIEGESHSWSSVIDGAHHGAGGARSGGLIVPVLRLLPHRDALETGASGR
jgi:hypothetical protein